MTKKLVYQVGIPNADPNAKGVFKYIQELYEESHFQARKYAKKCNADYYIVTDKNDWKPGIGKHLAYQKLKVYDFHEYDQIVYFDSDYIIKDIAPNIFNLLGNQFSAVTDVGLGADKHAKRLKIPANRYINSGFVYFTKNVIDKSREAVLNRYINFDYKLWDQCLMSKAFYELDIPYQALKAEEWNPADTGYGIYCDHFSGQKNKEKYLTSKK